MTHELLIRENETRTIDSGTTETHARSSVNGSLGVNGVLVLTGEEPRETSLLDGVGLDFPREVSFDDVEFDDSVSFEDYSMPERLVLSSMNMGIAVFLVGIMALMLGAAWIMKNYVAGVMWSISFILLILVGVFELPLEIYWASVLSVILLLILGMVVRWTGL